jgi:hypothetical protein
MAQANFISLSPWWNGTRLHQRHGQLERITLKPGDIEANGQGADLKGNFAIIDSSKIDRLFSYNGLTEGFKVKDSYGACFTLCEWACAVQFRISSNMQTAATRDEGVFTIFPVHALYRYQFSGTQQ